MTLLSMTRGDTAVFTVTLTDAAGAALDLAGKDLTFTAKRHASDADEDALIVKTIGAGIEVTSEAGGVAEITIDPADTSDVADGPSLVWDVQVESGSDVRTPLVGRLAISADVTRTVSGS